jgi:hypothetical protein
MRFFTNFLKFRGQRVITCPETKQGAAVRVDALHAAVGGDLRLSACTRWPERKGCDQACLSQIAAAPESCLVKSIVSKWYAGKTCVCCGRPITEISWHEAPPAVYKQDGKSCEWKDIPVEQLPEIFATSQPLCWYCNNIAEFGRLHPELITRRQRPADEPRTPLSTNNIY